MRLFISLALIALYDVSKMMKDIENAGYHSAVLLDEVHAYLLDDFLFPWKGKSQFPEFLELQQALFQVYLRKLRS